MSYRARLVWALTGSLLAGSAGPLAAQLCFHDRPGPGCRTTLVTEFGALMFFENEFRRTPSVHSAFWELGAIRNLGDGRRALGATLYASYDDSEWRHVLVGAKARGRLWLGSTVSLTGSAGVLFAGETARFPDEVSGDLPGFTGRIDLGLRDWAAVSLGVDAMGIRIPPGLQNNPDAVRRLGDERTSWFVGVKTGAYLGAVAGPAAVALIYLVNRIRD